MPVKKKQAKKRPLPKNLRGGDAKLPTEKEIFLKVSTGIKKFFRDKTNTNYGKWDGIIPFHAKAIERLNKLKPKCKSLGEAVRLSGQFLNLNRDLEKAIQSNNPKLLAIAIYNVTVFLNQNK